MSDTHNLSGDFRGSTINIKSTISGPGGTPHPALDPAAAARRLAELPTDGPLPPISPLPPGSRLPFSPNPLFVGREDDLRRLAAALKGGQTTAISPAVAATGLGGLGKSQLAVEFAHRYGQYFMGGVFWLSLAEASNVPVEIATCGGPAGLNLPNFEAHDLPAQAQLVQAAWRADIPRLLVFDNCEDEALLAHYRPPTGGCRILLTSRRAEWDPSLGVQSHPLKTLTRAQSVELLRQLTADGRSFDSTQDRPGTATESPITNYQSLIPPGHNVSNLQSLNEIAQELGDLPLALHLAGSFLRQYRHEVTPEAYLAELRAGALLEHDSLQGLDLSVSPTQHDLHVARTFVVSHNQLLLTNNPTDTLALALLARAAHFAPGEPIPRELLLKTIDRPDAAAQRQAARALRRLTDLGLLESEGDGGTLTLHRLLAHFARASSSDAEAQPAVEKTLQAEAQQINETGYPAPLLAWQSHLRHVTDTALNRQDNMAAKLSNSLLYHLHMTGDYRGAQFYAERALRLRESALGPDHPDTATSLNNLAALFESQGDYGAARPLYERALRLRESALGPDHPDTATSLNNLAALFESQGDYGAARPLYERALRLRESALGPDHPATATSLNNLALLFKSQGDYGAARPLYERALRLRESALGPDHPDTATSLNNLAELLRSQGDYGAARPLYERALRLRESALGPDHPATATSLNNLALLFKSQGDYGAARPLYERALRISESALGPDHPATATSLNNLALLFKSQGDYGAARPLYERALRISESALGPDHPATATSLNNLAELLRSQGDYGAARPLYERALRLRESALGPDHPAMIYSLNNLGLLLAALGEAATAQGYLARALAICEAKLGPQHPHTQTVRKNLAGLLEEMKGDAP